MYEKNDRTQIARNKGRITERFEKSIVHYCAALRHAEMDGAGKGTLLPSRLDF